MVRQWPAPPRPPCEIDCSKTESTVSELRRNLNHSAQETPAETTHPETMGEAPADVESAASSGVSGGCAGSGLSMRPATDASASAKSTGAALSKKLLASANAFTAASPTRHTAPSSTAGVGSGPAGWLSTGGEDATWAAPPSASGAAPTAAPSTPSPAPEGWAGATTSPALVRERDVKELCFSVNTIVPRHGVRSEDAAVRLHSERRRSRGRTLRKEDLEEADASKHDVSDGDDAILSLVGLLRVGQAHAAAARQNLAELNDLCDRNRPASKAHSRSGQAPSHDTIPALRRVGAAIMTVAAGELAILPRLAELPNETVPRGE